MLTLVGMLACAPTFALTVGISGAPVLEVGRSVLPSTLSGGSSGFSRVDFSLAFAGTPIVVVLGSNEGGQPAEIRVKNVDSSGFEIGQVEPSNQDGGHVAMTVNFIAVAPGIHEFDSGLLLEAGLTQTSSAVTGPTAFGGAGLLTQVLLEAEFDQVPAILAELQTINSEPAISPPATSTPFLSTSVDNIATDSFDVAIERAEVNDGGVVEEEEIGYIAISVGRYTEIDVRGNTGVVEAFVSPSIVQGWDNTSGVGDVVSFSQPIGPDPIVVANRATRDGNNGGWLRLGDVTADEAYLMVDEDTFTDAERSHIPEQVSVFVASEPFVRRVPVSGTMWLMFLALMLMAAWRYRALSIQIVIRGFSHRRRPVSAATAPLPGR